MAEVTGGNDMRPIFGRARNRLLAALVAFAAVPLILVLVIRAIRELEPVFAVVGVVAVARFGWQWYQGGRG